jgi:hypothetical protein
MKIVEETLDSLRNEITETILREKNDKKFQQMIAERNFFRKQALFMHEQNSSTISRNCPEAEGSKGKAQDDDPGAKPLQNAGYPGEGDEDLPNFK